MRDQARREAELILSEAHAEAREIQRRAVAENERLSLEARRVRAQLIDALSALDEPAKTDGNGDDADSRRRAGRGHRRRAQLVRLPDRHDAARRGRCIGVGAPT
jgi:hypothetical protein